MGAVGLVVVLVYLLVVVPGALADCVQQGPCSCQSPDGLIDLSPLDGHGTPTFKDQPGPGGGFLYSWNPCSPFSELQNCQSVSSCQVTQDQTNSFPLGTQDTAAFSTDPTTGDLTLQYSATDPSTGEFRTLAVSLICEPTTIPGNLNALGQIGPSLTYAMTLNSLYCCPGVGPHGGGGGGGGLSAGSILLIVFFTILLVYVIAGVVFMKFVRKAQGKEVIPNYPVWTALPGLIKDGALFTFRRACSLCGRKSGYDQI